MHRRFKSLCVVSLLFIASGFQWSFAQVQDALTFEPLEVQVTKGYGDHPWVIYVNKEAHVAAFEIVPDNGIITLVYPNEYQRSERLKKGETPIVYAPRTRRLYSTNKSYPKSNFLNRERGGPYRGGMNYVYVVAAEQPLSFSILEESPRSFRKRFGVNSFDVEKSIMRIEAQLTDSTKGSYRTALISF